MPQTLPDRVFEDAGARTPDTIPLPAERPLADPRLEPPQTGSFEDDMRLVQQRLEDSKASQRHFDHVVAGRLSGLRRAGKY